jgi:hypothetical protein
LTVVHGARAIIDGAGTRTRCRQVLSNLATATLAAACFIVRYFRAKLLIKMRVNQRRDDPDLLAFMQVKYVSASLQDFWFMTRIEERAMHACRERKDELGFRSGCGGTVAVRPKGRTLIAFLIYHFMLLKTSPINMVYWVLFHVGRRWCMR